MAAVKIKTYENGVMLIANDLLSGRTVYFHNSQTWEEFIGQKHENAAVAYSEDTANELLHSASSAVGAKPVIDPYAIELDKEGVPVHIRELLRSSGPSIAVGYQSTKGSNDVSI